MVPPASQTSLASSSPQKEDLDDDEGHHHRIGNSLDATHNLKRRPKERYRTMQFSNGFFKRLCLLPAAAWALSSVNRTQKQIPITILSGFLGAGKTTLLQNMLENKQGLKIGVVVNDVASVNIDSKLVARDTTTSKTGGGSDGMVELQNGCACCSLSEELLTSVSELVTMSDLRGEEDQFQHIVIELSGVADPKGVRAKFQEAVFCDMPLMERVQLDTLVTLIDSSMFKTHFGSTKTASRKETPELFFRDGEQPEESSEEEEWKKDLPPKLLEALLAGMNAPGADEQSSVADLLVSQAETADLVVLNKVDLVESEAELEQLKEILGALNPRAKMLTASFGKLAITDVLGVAKGEGVCALGVVDDHRDFVEMAVGSSSVKNDKSIEVTAAPDDCADPGCTDTTHSHSHAHSDHAPEDCAEPGCTDASHSHSHEDTAHAKDCTEPACTDAIHSHSHADAHAQDDCAEPACTDPSHNHSHSDSQGHAGIGTFVYTARRPFHPGRLVSFLRNLPVVRGVPEASEADTVGLTVSPEASEALATTLRSKGFMWCADSHTSAMYWSHAGSSFELSCLGQWWATLPRSEWPEDASTYVLRDFDDIAHEDEKNPENSVGDRRQEVVFIGPRFGDKSRQSLICQTLDQCLLGDVEYQEYKSIQYKEKQLETRFANAIPSKIVSY
jgi:G3E family GTPase